jgi:1,4-dihydroxy-2-naphthoyl-CoA hydrolase
MEPKMNRAHAQRSIGFRPDMTLDKMQDRLKGSLPELLGMELVSIKPGRLQSRLIVNQNLLAPNGFLHAATIIGLADTTCGFGTMAHLPEGAESFTTVELKANFMGTVREGGIHCEAQIEHSGRTLQVWDAAVTDEASGRTIALFRCTQMILWPKALSN